MRRITSFLAWSALVLGLGVVGIKPASALTISPPNLEYNLDPGQSVSQQIKLFNDEVNPITVYSSVANFTAQGETGDPTWDFTAEPTDLASWIKITGGPFTINPKSSIEVTAIFAVPATAEPGGHYASIFFGPQPSGTAGGQQVTIKWLISSLAIVRVSGDVRELASLAEFGLQQQKTTFSRLPVDFFLRVQNSGNVHVRPTGNVTVKNIFGRTSAVIPINEIKGAVLPDTIRRFGDKGSEIVWEKPAWAKYKSDILAAADTPDELAAAEKKLSQPGNFFQEIGREWNNFGFGPYTVTADLTYGQDHRVLSGSLKFWVLPWRLLVVSIVGLALIIFLLIIGIKGYNKSIITRARKQTESTDTGEKKSV